MNGVKGKRGHKRHREQDMDGNGLETESESPLDKSPVGSSLRLVFRLQSWAPGCIRKTLKCSLRELELYDGIEDPQVLSCLSTQGKMKSHPRKEVVYCLTHR